MKPLNQKTMFEIADDIATAMLMEIEDAKPKAPELTDEQKLFVSTILETKKSVLCLGKAGVGKSLTMNSLIQAATDLGKKFVVCAPTGVAAINVGGITIHRLINILKQSQYQVRLDFILIDECSMVRADLFDRLDKALRKATRQDEKPFGGVQIALVGDFAQLPPVVTKEDDHIMREYLSPYIFSAHAFPEVTWEILELTKVFRQKDGRYVELLNDIRRGDVGKHLELINSLTGKAIGTILTPTNALAAAINSDKLAKLDGESFSFRASISGRFERSEYPAEECLVLKRGARVMCIRNLYSGAEEESEDGESGSANRSLILANGDVGEVKDITSDGVVFLSHRTGEEIVMPEKMLCWEKKDMVPATMKDEQGNDVETLIEEVVGTFMQIPLRLAWAVTIHKSQGMTLPEMTLDLRRNLFAAGQAYVALSRGTDLDKVRILGKMSAKDVIVCPYVTDFVEKKMLSNFVEREDNKKKAFENEQADLW